MVKKTRCGGRRDMVKRCGFLTMGANVVYKPVSIEWDLGFTREAKIEYIKRLHDELHEIYPNKRIAEVTSASNVYETRMLSPFYVKAGNTTLEYLWQEYGSEYSKDEVKAVFTHLYYMCIKDNLRVIHNYDIFTDVFHKVDGDGFTQAESCAVIKLLTETGQEHILKSADSLRSWLEKNSIFSV